MLSIENQSEWNTYSDYILYIIFDYKYYINEFG